MVGKVLFVVAAVFPCACNSTPNTPADAARVDAHAVDGRPIDGGSAACGQTTGGVCNDLQNLGTVVTAACSTAATPTMTGGAIADGTYVLTSATLYLSSCSDVILPTGGPTTIAIAGDCEQSIDASGGAQTYTISTTGNVETQTRVCVGPLTVMQQYTATATSIAELQPFGSGSIVSTFQMQ
jgi:hypothetical protein